MLFNISKELAKEILECQDDCYSEGQGGDIKSLIIAIGKEWPGLKQEYDYLPMFDENYKRRLNYEI